MTAPITTFIDGVLDKIGAPVNATTISSFTLWLENEQGGIGAPDFDHNQGNPLGIQTPAAQASGKKGRLATAIELTANELLTNSDYTGIVAEFRKATSNEAIAQAIVNSPWNSGKAGGSSYGGLANFQSGGKLGAAVAGAGAGNAAQLSTSSSSGLTAQEAQEIDTPYTGPGAYKGFDLSGITAGQRANVENAINTVLKQPGGVKGILNAIYKNYGSEAWMANVPQLRTMLVAGSLLGWNDNKALWDSELQNTQWYKSSSPSLRLWDEMADDPAAQSQAINDVSARIVNDANALGIPLSSAQVASLAKTLAPQSISGVTGNNEYDNTVLSENQIYQAITAMAPMTNLAATLSAAPTAPTPATATQAASTVVGGANASGDASALYNAFTQIARNYMLPMTAGQIATAVQNALKTDTGEGNFQSGAVANFTTLAQQQAQKLYPAFASAVGTTGSGGVTGTDQNMYNATSGYRSIIAQFTGNPDPDTIDLTSPQWAWILSGGQPPTTIPASLGGGTASPSAPTASSGGAAAPPTIDALQTYLMQTPQFQSTNAGKAMGWQIGSAITKAFGFNS